MRQLSNSSFLSITEATHVPVWVVPGTISFPWQPEASVIMVGPGTGCAPFRAYIEERVGQNAPGQSTLYSACEAFVVHVHVVS